MIKRALPEVVLVHGACHTPSIYGSFIRALEKQGFTVHCPHLPSCNGDRPPTKTLTDDVEAVRHVLQDLVNRNKKIILVMHSYGGIVGTDAVTEDLTLAKRSSSVLPGGVSKLIYLAAYVLEPGSCVWDVVQKTGVDKIWKDHMDDDADGTCFPRGPAEMFYNGADQTFIDSALPQLVRQPLSTFHSKTSGSAWKTVPAIYVATQQDRAVPGIYQDLMLQGVKDAGVHMSLETYDTGHSPFVTKEKEIVDLVKRAAQ